ncbi:MAG TPA: hypothetical protein VJU77_13850 [Chthoniobacterales bacterium]|nr:hypothetical protein [Chthoniobacterales bacterium]
MQRSATGPVAGRWPAGFVPPLEGQTHLFSRDEKFLVITSWHGRWLSFSCDPFQLLDYAEGRDDTDPAWAMPVLRGSDGVIHLVLSDREKGTRLRPIDDANKVIILSDKAYPLSAADWHPSEPFLAVSTGAQSFALFHADTGARLCADVSVAHPISSLRFHPGGDFLLCDHGDQEGDGWVVLKARAPFSVVSEGVSKGQAMWLPGKTDGLIEARMLGLRRFSAPDFATPERLDFDAINATFSGVSTDLPRILLEPLTGRFEVFDLRLGWRLSPNDALPEGLQSPVIDSTGGYVAATLTPALDANDERNPHPISHLGIWQLPLALPADRGVVPDLPIGADGPSPDGAWSFRRPRDSALLIRRLGGGDMDWTLELEERAIDAAQWQRDGRTLAVRYRANFVQHLPWPPPAESDEAITRFAVLLGGRELKPDGSLATLSLETQSTWREHLRTAQPRHQRWKELRDWWLAGRPSTP